MSYEPVVLEKKLNSPRIIEIATIENQVNAGTKELMALSLFSGGGGLDLGFSAAGFRVGCSTDIDPFSCKTLILNNGRKVFYNHAHSITADITEISAEYLLTNAELSNSEIDIVLGGPPCQAFSIFGRRQGLDDPRGNLVWEYLKIIQEIKPKAFVFENVPGLKSIHDGKLFEEILRELTINDTYAISTHNYQMAEYGIPQFRERVFIIGAKNGSLVPPMLPTHGNEPLLGLKNYRTVREALRYLPEPGTFSKVPNHIGRKHSPRIVSRYENLKFGERDPKTRINKLHPERPSFTIIVGSDKGGGKGHIHPFVPREVTPRESARMQTFPDWWEFYGTGRHVIRQVGNAVPPLFAALLAEHLRVHIFEETKQKSYEDFIDILGLGYLQE
ncbi:DNA cytosine methyltransferase (plasmid) [Tolypothrix sp. PCC 7712]|uniref:DNA cytosine methyltransferase n=1 Tax=Tolypothrix sp. PCC 7712 TaxID=2596898 RepID=UPI0021F71B53|nr:DNA cytosine methyltransferase [Tolypothrix sp. PCC 7712]UYD31070.1 DNA cytosine methyltransferase [Tolypothrix sp. PCC 7712]